MKVTSFTGITERENILIHKPATRLLVVADYGTGKAVSQTQARIRVRLENSNTAESVEIVPNIPLETLSEIATFSEGFFRRAITTKGTGESYTTKGKTYYTVVLNVDGSVALNTDKFLSVDLLNLNSEATYSMYALESETLDEFYCRYQKYNLSVGELQKNYSVGDNEALCLPSTGLREVQLFAKDGKIAPTFSRDELVAMMDMRNDLVTVYCGHGAGEHPASHLAGNQDGAIICGTDGVIVLDLEKYSSFEIRRENGEGNYEFYMIDNKK